MMTFADEVEEVLLELPPLDELGARIRRSARVNELHQTLRTCYAEYGGKGAPTIAIVDWPKEKTAHELRRTAARFSALGSPTVVAAPTELRYLDGRLRVDGRPIDLVYRRVLCKDFLLRKEECAALLTAYRDGAVCMANPLRSYIVGTKAFLALLHDPQNPADLSAKERDLVGRVIPQTRFVTERIPAAERHQWALKKAESYGGKDVVLGSLVDAAGWDEAVAASLKGARWVMQALEPIPTLGLPVLAGERLVLEQKFLNWNPFVYGGRHGGSIARVSDSILINISRGGGLLPTLRVG
jgi:uncharacterized circularly permuted ATP-grasp superfamily protein